MDAYYRTKVEHIYAVGDVIGFPALASTAMEQGRLAACHAYGVPTNSIPGAVSLWHLRHPGDLDGRPNRGPTDQGRDSLRGGLRNTKNWRAASFWGTKRECSSC